MGLLDVILEVIVDHPIIVLLLTIVTLLVLYFQVIIHRGLPSNIPPFEKGLPYLGQVIKFGKNPLQVAQKMHEKHGDIFTMQVLGDRLTFLCSADAHEIFFKGNDEELDQNEPYKFSVPIFGESVVYGVPLETRLQQLRFMRGSLQTNKMKQYVSQISKETEDFFEERWGEEGIVDLREEFAELIILTAARTLMGKEIREQLHTEIAKLYKDLDEGLTPLSFFFPHAPIPQHKKRDRARQKMVEIFSKIMKDRNNNPEEEHDDVLQVFMNATYKDGRKLTEEEVAGMMIALLFAGQHTSSITSTWTGLYLIENPNYLERVMEEQNNIINEYGEELTYEALNEMVILHNAIKESLRLQPPLIFLMRKLLVPKQYKNYTIPAGDTLFLSPSISGRLEHVFENSDKFDPDRFLKRNEDKKYKYGYVGFGGGRHGCLGEQFAYMQIKSIWSVIFRKYKLEIVGDFPEPDYSALVVGPTQPCKIKYTRIN